MVRPRRACVIASTPCRLPSRRRASGCRTSSNAARPKARRGTVEAGFPLVALLLFAHAFEFPQVRLLIHELAGGAVALGLLAGQWRADLRALSDRTFAMVVAGRGIRSHAPNSLKPNTLSQRKRWSRRCMRFRATACRPRRAFARSCANGREGGSGSRHKLHG